MRYSILLLAAAALVAVQSAPVKIEPEAGTVRPNRELPCFKDHYTGEWVCPLTDDVEARAGDVAPQGRVCRKVGQKWICDGDK
ncbi:hypothetical protein BGW39_011182 [Mortierella sp. 14UC]|nr:hypothetical protein BGW39_011182 [Mortierella sp. 14UC]